MRIYFLLCLRAVSLANKNSRLNNSNFCSALKRHVEKCQNNGGITDVAPKPLEDSDGEYDVDEVDVEVCGRSSPWPSDVEFSNNYRWDSSIPIKEEYSPPITRHRKARLSNKVYFKRIADANHPANGEFGLFCSNDAKPGSWLLDYVGHVSLGENQDKESDYVSDFGLKSELACDANTYGNEARMINDFRNTGRYPNVEFNLRRDKCGELRQGVYVKSTKDARQVGFDGIKKDEELLISYGKSYWRSRVGSGGMEGFVWRYPGQPMPPGGQPNTSKSGHERQDGPLKQSRTP